MYKIVRAEELTTNIYLFEVEAKRVAKACLPGQFVIVRTGEDGERIPLTIKEDHFCSRWSWNRTCISTGKMAS